MNVTVNVVFLLPKEKQKQLVALVEEVGNLKGNDGPEDRELLE